jgi:TRAP-type C4-dicarboxylate transport system permease small subunit
VVQRLDRASAAGMVLGGVACLGMAGLVTLEVLLRGALNTSTQVADEWAGYLLLAASFLGLGYTARHDAFIRVELLVGRLAARHRPVARAVNLVAAGAVGAVLLFWLAVQAEQAYRMDLRSIFISRTPLWLPQAVMVVGLAVFVLQLVAEALRLARREPAGG